MPSKITTTSLSTAAQDSSTSEPGGSQAGGGQSEGWPSVSLDVLGSYAGRSLAHAGNTSLSHPFDLDNSPGISYSAPSLVYNSNSVSVLPIVQATVKTDPSTPLAPVYLVNLVFGGTNYGTQSYSTTGLSPGDTLTFARPVTSAVTGTGRYAWQLTVTADYAAPLLDVETILTGAGFVVDQNSSPYGAGWTFSMADQLISIASSSSGPAGLLRLFGSGGHRFYEFDATTSSYKSPPGDNGILSAVSGGWQYVNPAGETWNFNSGGMQTSWVSADGEETTSFTYTDGDSDGATDDLSGMTTPDGASTTFNYTSGNLSSVAIGSGPTALRRIRAAT